MPDIKLDFRIPQILPATLPVVPLRKGLLLPATVQSYGIGREASRLAVGAAKGDLIIVAVQRDPVAEPVPSDLLPIATLARILDRPGNGILVQGLCRVTLTGFTSTRPYLEASYERVVAEWPQTVEAEALARTFREAVKDTAALFGAPGQAFAAGLISLPAMELQVDAVAGMADAPDAWKREILATIDPMIRAERVLEQVQRAKELIAAQKSIKERVETQNRDAQKEHLLRAQLRAIQQELGEDSDNEIQRLKERLAEAALPDEVRETVDRELRRLDRVSQGPERNVAMDWLSWIADMPWGKKTAVDLDLAALETALENSHFGLEEVKRQVVEHLAVRKLAGRGRADVLLLVGPPGVGKTSIGQAIADATARKLVRVALGGVRDEAELRGHRRTYIGARPGRLVEGIRRAGTADPVVLLDEIDKLGKGYQGDPGAALLEILDPEQNHAFTDHYLEVPFDLSRVLFIATANDLSTIPEPLRDRMEILHLEGYAANEKLQIARKHLLTKLAENAGLAPGDVEVSDEAVRAAMEGWTREAGVRQLQRVLGRIFRAAAVLKARGELKPPLRIEAGDLPAYLKNRRFREANRDLPDRAGIATGLAWTPVGGDVLTIEASLLPGRGNLVLTGQLGDVMKESARAALTYTLSNHEALGIPRDIMEKHDIHVHVPAGAVPKDGPSAGVTIFTALASLLSGKPIADDLAMTGEATLRGRVLPVGGIKSKVLAAHRMGLKRVVIPKANEDDLDELPPEVREALQITLVERMEEVLAVAFSEPLKARATA